MSRYEAAVRSTLRSPARIYDDPYSTSQRRTPTTPGATVVCYLALGYTRGREAGNWLVVIVLWEHDLARHRDDGLCSDSIHDQPFTPALGKTGGCIMIAKIAETAVDIETLLTMLPDAT